LIGSILEKHYVIELFLAKVRHRGQTAYKRRLPLIVGYKRLPQPTVNHSTSRCERVVVVVHWLTEVVHAEVCSLPICFISRRFISSYVYRMFEKSAASTTVNSSGTARPVRNI